MRNVSCRNISLDWNVSESLSLKSFSIERNDSLWNDVFFSSKNGEHKNLLHRVQRRAVGIIQLLEIDPFEMMSFFILIFESEKDFGPEAYLRHLKAQTCATRVFILCYSCNFDNQLDPNFHRLVILRTCSDTPSEKTGL